MAVYEGRSRMASYYKDRNPNVELAERFGEKIRGMDFMQDDKGLFQKGKYAGPGIKEGLKNVREYFGDRLDAMKVAMQNRSSMRNPATVPPSVTDTTSATASRSQQQANATGQSLSFDPSKTMERNEQGQLYHNITSDQLGQWGQVYGQEATLGNYANWWNKQNYDLPSEQLIGPNIEFRGAGGL